MNAIDTINAQVPELIRQLENALRGGYNLYQAFEIAARDMDEPMRSEAAQLTADMRAEAGLLEACAGLVRRTGSRDLDLMAACIRLQVETGGNLADKLSLLGLIMERRTLTAG